MRRTWLSATFVAGAAVLGLTWQSALSQQGDGMPDAAQMQEMMKKWLETTTPGPQHELLAKRAGEWNVVMKSFWGGPGSPAMETKGVAKIRPILGGRFMLEEYSGEVLMPDASGAMAKSPFEGVGLAGYDKARNVFVGTWCDSMGTQLLTMKGGMVPGSNTLTMYGEMDEPMLGIVGRMVKYVGRSEGDDKYVFEMYDLHAGDNYKAMELTYTRKQ